MGEGTRMTAEEPVRFGAHRTTVGILTTPQQPASDVAVILLNAGLIHHVGPHRLHVRLARALGGRGIACVRFDFSGIGDSPPRPDNLPIFDMVVKEPCEAMDELARRGYRRFVLAGICSGAYSAFKASAVDPRVCGAILINPQDFAGGQGGETRAWERRYLTRSIFRARAWINLLTGRVDYARLARTAWARVSGRAARTDQELATVRDELRQLIERGSTRILFIVSEDDVSAEYLELVLGPQGKARDGVDVEVIAGSDHLFTRMADQARLMDIIGNWTCGLSARAERLATSPIHAKSRMPT
jgi:pimeloyl-ACP methyl ester carboxylesterase